MHQAAAPRHGDCPSAADEAAGLRDNADMSAVPALAPADPAAAAPAWQGALSELGDAFFSRVQPQALQSPYWIDQNLAHARELGLDEHWMQSQEALLGLTGCAVLPGTDPLASVYSGHQFGHWAGQLGDGRALLLGRLPTPQGPVEIQLKGAGRTPIRAWEMAGRCCALPSESICAARPCMGWASPPRRPCA